MTALRIAALGLASTFLLMGCSTWSGDQTAASQPATETAADAPDTTVQAMVSPDVADIQVDAVTNPKADLSGYQTYAWESAAAAIHDPDGQWTPSNLDVSSEIMSLVDRELARQGRLKVIDQPDVLVMFAVGVDMTALEVKTDPQTSEETFREVPKGGLLVILADAATGQAIWVGGASGDVQDQPTAELTRRRLDFAIAQMFSDFGKAE